MPEKVAEQIFEVMQDFAWPSNTHGEWAAQNSFGLTVIGVSGEYYVALKAFFEPFKQLDAWVSRAAKIDAQKMYENYTKILTKSPTDISPLIYDSDEVKNIPFFIKYGWVIADKYIVGVSYDDALKFALKGGTL